MNPRRPHTCVRRLSLLVLLSLAATSCADGAGALGPQDTDGGSALDVLHDAHPDAATAPDARLSTDAGPSDAPAFTSVRAVEIGLHPLDETVLWTLSVRVRAGAISVAAVRVELEGGAGWAVEASVQDPGGDPRTLFEIRGTAVARQPVPLDAVIVVSHPAVPTPLRVSLFGDAEGSPFELYDPEDIGFGAIEVGRAAEVIAFFSAPVEVELPASIAANRLSGPIPEPWVEGLRLRFAPGAARGAVAGTLVSGGRRIPVSGRAVSSALRVIPNRVPVGDLAPDACQQVSVRAGNGGLAPAASPPLTLRTSGFARAEWSDAFDSSPFSPLEERVVTATVCATGRGPFEVEFAAPDAVVATVVGAARGPELEVPTALAIETTAGLTRRFDIGVANRGRETLRIDRVDVPLVLGGSVRALSPMPVELAPGRTAQLGFELDPLTDGSATLLFRTNDPDRSRTDVAVSWQAEANSCALVVETPSVDFGTFAERGTAQSGLILRNTASGPCTVLVPEALPPPFEWSVFDAESTWDDDRRAIRIPARSVVAPAIWLRNSGLGTFAERIVLETPPGALPNRNTVVPLSAEVVASGLGVVVRRTPACLLPTDDRVSFDIEFEVRGGDEIRFLDTQTRAFGRLSSAPTPEWPTRIAGLGRANVVLGLTEVQGGVHAMVVTWRYSVGASPAVRTAQRTLIADFESPLEAVDSFRQIGFPKVDLVFVVDGSGSMDDIDTVESNVLAIGRFLFLQAIGARVFFAAADPPGPMAMGPTVVAPPSEPLAVDVAALDELAVIDGVRQRLALAQSFSRAGLEQPLDAAQRVVSDLLGQGELRDDAVLSIVVLSDEDDFSPGPTEPKLVAFWAVKGFRNTNLFSFSAIAGVPFGGCTAPRTALRAPRLSEVANRTGGIVGSLCNPDWSRAFEFSTVTFGFKSRFFLTEQPVVDQIRVFVDGVEVAQMANGQVNWTYDFGTNSINFSPFSTPSPGVEIEVRYALECL